MKTFIAFLLITTTSFAAECKLVGTLESEQTLETTLGTRTFEECHEQGKRVLFEKFYGLVSTDDKLVSATVKFRGENGIKTEVIQAAGSSDF